MSLMAPGHTKVLSDGCRILISDARTLVDVNGAQIVALSAPVPPSTTAGSWCASRRRRWWGRTSPHRAGVPDLTRRLTAQGGSSPHLGTRRTTTGRGAQLAPWGTYIVVKYSTALHRRRPRPMPSGAQPPRLQRRRRLTARPAHRRRHDHGWTLRSLTAIRTPGGPDHYAGHPENSDGFEVELVADYDETS